MKLLYINFNYYHTHNYKKFLNIQNHNFAVYYTGAAKISDGIYSPALSDLYEWIKGVLDED